MRLPLLLAAALALGGAMAARAQTPALPRAWVDPATGHRIRQLSQEPGSACLYFTQYAYTAGGTKLLMTAPHGIDLVDLGTGAIERVFEGQAERVLQTGRKTGAIFYAKDGFLYSLDPATKVSRQVAKAPPQGSFLSVNADETLAAGTITLGAVKPGTGPHRPAQDPADAVQKGGDNYPDKHAMMDRRLAERLPMVLFTVNLQTGAYQELLRTTDWLGHVQFSPTDPLALMYCHEGRQWKLDRIWLIRADGHSAPMLVHQRTMRMEVAVHEYWSNDGQWIYYDLQTPLPEDFWVAGYNVTDGRRVWYHLDTWRSVHYNTSPDGTLFSGDGLSTDTTLVYGQPTDTQWMLLMRPSLIPNQEGETPDQAHMIQAGRFTSERLVDLRKHDYSLEPNGNFTPDGKWLVFRSNLRGPIQVYAVEIAKAVPAVSLFP
jgi:oligogalacturonide lyase